MSAWQRLSDWWDAGPKPRAIDREETPKDLPSQMDKWKTPGFDGRATHPERTAVSVLATSLPVVRMSGPEYERFVAGANERHWEFEAGYKAWRDQSYTRGEHGHWQDKAGNGYTGERLREDYSKQLGGLSVDSQAQERSWVSPFGREIER